MSIYDSHPLGSGEASVEFGVIFVKIRQRARYWVSTLDLSTETKTNLFGVVVALRFLREQPCGLLELAIATSEIEYWETHFLNWFERFRKKFPKKIDADDLKVQMLNEFAVLKKLGSREPKQSWGAGFNADFAAFASGLS
jgi:hypothetical protein